MIIVEGMDNTGKTTLIQAVANALKLTIVKSYHLPWENYGEMWLYDDWITDCPQPVIMDRHPYISDYVYGRVIRKETHATIHSLKTTLKDNMVIYCRPPLEVIMRSIHERDQMVGVTDHSSELLEEYDRLLLGHTVPYDYINDSVELIIELARKYLENENC